MQSWQISTDMVKTTEIDGIIKDGKLHVFRSGERCDCNKCSLYKECYNRSFDAMPCALYGVSGYFEKVGELMTVKHQNPNLN